MEMVYGAVHAPSPLDLDMDSRMAWKVEGVGHRHGHGHENGQWIMEGVETAGSKDNGFAIFTKRRFFPLICICRFGHKNPLLKLKERE